MEIKALASGSTGNAYRIDDGKTPLLIECGIGIEALQQKLNYGLSRIQGCLISHQHGDHAKAVNHLLNRGVDCYMSRECADALKVINHHNCYTLDMLEESEEYLSFGIGSWVVSPFKAVHDVVCTGFLLDSAGGERLVYLSDSAYSPYKFPGVTHFLLGCNYDLDIVNENIESGSFERAAKPRLLHSHASIQTVKEMLLVADRSKLKEVHLVHISSRNGDPERFKREVAEIVGYPVYVH